MGPRGIRGFQIYESMIQYLFLITCMEKYINMTIIAVLTISISVSTYII